MALTSPILALRAAALVPAGLLLPVATVLLMAAVVAAPRAWTSDEVAALLPAAGLSGGATTVDDATRDSFTLPADNISDEHRRAFMVGQSVFNQNWVAAPSSNRDRQGLGPLFNARSCSSCHVKAGRGAPPAAATGEAGEAGEAGEPTGLLLRLSVPGTDAHGGPLPEPRYGGQFHPYAISGIEPDGVVEISVSEEPGRYGDGTAYTLGRPTYRCTHLAYGDLDARTLLSPRVAPQLCGLGLLAAISEDSLRACEVAERQDPDGVRGHANHVWNVRLGRLALGRFGWKAGQPTLEQQSAAAFNGDIGITSSLFGEENTPPSHLLARNRPSGGTDGGPELTALKLARLTQWTHLIGVPRRRDGDDPAVVRGEAAFARMRCDACHLPSVTTGVSSDFPELSQQTIHAYTDLLLHDLGDDLADGRPEYAAGPRDWRTPPLWGIGLISTVNGHHRLLHDGRARDLAEAILWHGGEAQASRARFRAADAGTRTDLIAFLASL
jgi:CxxC motif-containing protein (DUF1111 family)